MVHGNVGGVEPSRRALSDWLDWMGLMDAGDQALLDRYIGYYEPYATSHESFDADQGVQEETRNVSRAVARFTQALRSTELPVSPMKLTEIWAIRIRLRLDRSRPPNSTVADRP